MLLRVILLPDGRVDEALEDVLGRGGRLDVLHQLVRIRVLLAPQVVDDQVEAGLGQHVDQARQHLHGAFATAKHHEVVANQVASVHRAQVHRLDQRTQLGLGVPAIEELVCVACLRGVRN